MQNTKLTKDLKAARAQIVVEIENQKSLQEEVKKSTENIEHLKQQYN